MSGGSTAGPGELYDALLAGLESQSSWPTLADTLAQADGGDGTSAASMSIGTRRAARSNGAEAEQAIDCVDHPVTGIRRSTRHSPHRWAGQPRSSARCWPGGCSGVPRGPPLPTRTPSAATDPGAPPILVVGTTGDPVTPYRGSVDLARELSGGALLTWDGNSHVAYFYSPCVRATVQSYLLDGTVPPTGATCTD